MFLLGVGTRRWHLDDLAMLFEVFEESVVETVLGEGPAVADDDDLHAGAGDGDVHTPQVAQEAYLPFVVVAYHADDYHVALLSLETVDGVDADLVAEAAVEALHLEEPSYKAYLGAVG